MQHRADITVESIGEVRRWSMLAIAVTATMSANVLINGVAFLIPTLHIDRGLHLAQAGLLSAMPCFGVATTMIGWGYLVDRVGERRVLTLGMSLTAAATFAAAWVDSLVAVGVFLFLGGMAAASNTAAGGRLVVGWFPAQRRGLVMGIRHTASPLGVAAAAMVIPHLGHHYGVAAALLFPAVLCALSAVSALGVINPHRPPHAEAPPAHLANPYRGSKVLWRIHAASMLLVVPQSVVWTFTLVWLMVDRGWTAASAGLVVTVAQLLGAAGRVAAGHWSDRLNARLRPIRTIGVAAAAAMLLVALSAWLDSPLSAVVIVGASVITVVDNGLAFTGIAEIAGPFWSGRALGVQYTSQMVTMGGTPPLFGALIAAAGYPVAFAVSAIFALAAVPVIPVHGDRDRL